MALAVHGWHMQFHIDEPTDITVSKYSSVANFHSSSLKQNIALSCSLKRWQNLTVSLNILQNQLIIRMLRPVQIMV